MYLQFIAELVKNILINYFILYKHLKYKIFNLYFK